MLSVGIIIGIALVVIIILIFLMKRSKANGSGGSNLSKQGVPDEFEKIDKDVGEYKEDISNHDAADIDGGIELLREYKKEVSGKVQSSNDGEKP